MINDAEHPGRKIHSATRKAGIPGLLFGILVFLASSCSHVNNVNQSSLALLKADSGSTVNVAAGRDISLKLQTIGPGQYDTPMISTSSVQFISNDIVPPYLPAGATQLYLFRALTPGSARISISHSVQADTFSVTINVVGG